MNKKEKFNFILNAPGGSGKGVEIRAFFMDPRPFMTPEQIKKCKEENIEVIPKMDEDIEKMLSGLPKIYDEEKTFSLTNY